MSANNDGKMEDEHQAARAARDSIWQHYSPPTRTTPDPPTGVAHQQAERLVAALNAVNQPRRGVSYPPMGRRAQCTHVVATRTRKGNLTCSSCGKIPKIGWVYACAQDDEMGYESQLPGPNPIPELVLESPDVDPFVVKATNALRLGMKPDVTQGMLQGHYTLEQAETLIQQRIKVMKILDRAEKASFQSAKSQWDAVCYNTGAEGMVKVGNLVANVMPDVAARMPPYPSAVGEKPKLSVEDMVAIKKVSNACYLRFCHHCRHFFKDRIYCSFESVFEDKLPPLTKEEADNLHIMDRNLCLNIGLRPSPEPLPSDAGRQTRQDSTETQNHEESNNSSDWTISDDDDGANDQDETELYTCPGRGFCPVWSGYSGCAYDKGFNDGKRALAHGLVPDPQPITPENSRAYLGHSSVSLLDTPGGASSTASSISLPTPTSTLGTSPFSKSESRDNLSLLKLYGTAKAHSVCGEVGAPRVLVNDSDSSLDSDVDDEDDGVSQAHLTGGLSIQPHHLHVQDSNTGLGIELEDNSKTHLASDDLGVELRRLRMMPSSSSLGSEVEVNGGVALTEEAVEMGVPDIAD